jgi:lipid A 4'-phosphatase
MLPAVLIGVLIAIPFCLWPQLDLAITHQLAFTPDIGFMHKNAAIVLGLYTGVRIITAALVASFLLLLLWRRLKADAPLPILKKSAPLSRSILYLMLVMAIGPGMVVHWGFKEEFERPRPRQVLEFGGTLAYAPPPFTTAYWQNKPTEGRAFPSGHAAMGYYLMAFAFLAQTRRAKLLWLGGGTVAGLMVGLGRILQGGHWASDILFSGVVVLFVSALLHRVLFPPTPRESTSPAQP